MTCNICNTTELHFILLIWCRVWKKNTQRVQQVHSRVQAKTPKLADTFKRKVKNIIEKVIKLIALDHQFISMVEHQSFLCHLEFLNPQYALPSQHYITLTPLSSYNVPLCTLVSCVLYSRACETGNWGDAERVWNRQATCPRHFMWQCKEYEKSNGWYGGTKCGLHPTHTSAGCTWGSAVTVEHHILTC